MMKLVNGNENSNEINFCKSYSHRCLTQFYGFIMKKGEIIGFIYEYQSNGTLSCNNKCDNMFSLITISRLFEAIEYLHINSLIDRDIKPLNIFINHNGLPFLSDYDTIRQINDELTSEFTNDIGSPLYSSPEQDKNDNISFETDIYSFGLIIYYLFEKKDMWTSYFAIKENRIKPITKGSTNIKYLYEKCVEYDPKKE